MVNFFSVTSGKLIECHKAVFGKLIHCHGGKQSKCQLVNFFIDIHIERYFKKSRTTTMNSETHCWILLVFYKIVLRKDILNAELKTTPGEREFFGFCT